MKELVIVFLIVISTNVGWLFNIMTSFPVYYINFIILPILLLTVFFPNNIKLHKEDFIVLLFFMLSIISLLKTTFYSEQSIISGLKVAKFDFLILFYFIVRNDRLDVAKINKAILIFGLLISLVIIYASLSQNEALFSIAYSSSKLTRYGLARYVLGIPVIGYCCIFLFVQFMRNQKVISAVLCGYFLITLIFFMQTRSIIVAMTLVMTFIYVWYAGKNIVVSIFLVFAFLGFMSWQVYSEQSLTRRYIQTTQSEIKKSSKEINSISSRQISHGYFLKEFLKHPIVGMGEFWSDSSKLEERKKLRKPIFEADVGLAAVLYKHGIIGAIWLIGFFYIVLFRFRKNVRFEAVDHYFFFFLFCLISGITLDFFTDQKKEIFTFFVFGLYARCFRESSITYNNS